MFEAQIDQVAGHYAGLLSKEGRRAFVAMCVRRGYSHDAAHKEEAVKFFEPRDISYAGMYRDTPSGGFSVATICRTKRGKKSLVAGAEGHMRDCEREGLFDAAVHVARSIGDVRREAMYVHLDSFMKCGPYDEGHLLAAADIALAEAKRVSDAKLAAQFCESAAYLREKGESVRAFMKSCRNYDFA